MILSSQIAIFVILLSFSTIQYKMQTWCCGICTYLIVATVFNQINTVYNNLLHHEREIISHTVATLIQDT